VQKDNKINLTRKHPPHQKKKLTSAATPHVDTPPTLPNNPTTAVAEPHIWLHKVTLAVSQREQNHEGIKKKRVQPGAAKHTLDIKADRWLITKFEDTVEKKNTTSSQANRSLPT
jgi:hypothetical protein